MSFFKSWAAGDGNDTFNGGNGSDTQEVNGSNAGEFFILNGSSLTRDVDSVTLTMNLVESLDLRGLDGNDIFFVSSSTLASIRFFGGDGSDVLIAATHNSSTFASGGAGSDNLQGGMQSDHLMGDDGNDSLIGSGGADTVFGGSGDIFRFNPGVSGAEVLFSNGSQFGSETSMTGAGHGPLRWHVGDFDGDRSDDIFRFSPGVSGAEVFLSNPGFGSGPQFLDAGSWTGAGNGAEGWYLGDFNGDRTTDIFRFMPGSSGADMFLAG